MHILLPLLFIILTIYGIMVGIKGNNKKQADDSALNSLRKKYDLIRNKNLLVVDNFNKWFNAPKPAHIYAHSGIFGRTDKLGEPHFVHYIASFGLTPLEAEAFYDDNGRRFQEFHDEVRANWMSDAHITPNFKGGEPQG